MSERRHMKSSYPGQIMNLEIFLLGWIPYYMIVLFFVCEKLTIEHSAITYQFRKTSQITKKIIVSIRVPWDGSIVQSWLRGNQNHVVPWIKRFVPKTPGSDAVFTDSNRCERLELVEDAMDSYWQHFSHTHNMKLHNTTCENDMTNGGGFYFCESFNGTIFTLGSKDIE